MGRVLPDRNQDADCTAACYTNPMIGKRILHSLDISEEAGVRSLHFGSDWVQGAMRIRKPDALELEYTREMLACLLW